MKRYLLPLLVCVLTAIAAIWAAGAPERVSEPVPGESRLVSVQQMCEPPGANPTLVASLQHESPSLALSRAAASFLIAPFQAQGMTEADWEKAVPASLRRRGDVFEPLMTGNSVRVRTIADTYPTYTAVGVNLQTDEVFLQDNNLWSYRVFNRLENTPPGVEMSRPKRIVQGPATNIQFNNGIYVDQKDGKVYSVESDTGDKMVAFAGESNGDATPRILHTPHRVYSIAADEAKGELYMTVEFPPQIVVYRKQAAGEEQPLKRIRGDRTKLQTPHGIAIDQKNRLLFVNNWGQGVNFDETPNGQQGTGRFDPPSITVYSLDAEGNAPPLRVIQGEKTQLNWPGNMSFDQEAGELYIANDVDHSVLVFNGLTSAKGDVPPARVIKGDKTNLFYPTGVFVDTKHQELWVSNLGSSSVNVYPLKASGNVHPLRRIRSAPEGHRSLTFGRPASVAYDRNRQEILVPN